MKIIIGPEKKKKIPIWHRGQDSSVNIAMGYVLGGWGLIPGRGKGFLPAAQHTD
jgi:hypothetical protein